MSFRDTVKWIKTAEARKTPEKTVKTKLKKSGWSDSDINLALKIAHKGKVNWWPLLIAFVVGFILPFFFMSDDWIIWTIFSTIFSVFYALVPHKDDESYFHSLILIFTSSMLAFLVTNFIYNGLARIVIKQIVNSFSLILALHTIIAIILAYIFYLTLSLLSKQFLGYFDWHAYFSFKHWPWKIFTVNWKKKWTLLSYATILGLVVVMVLIVAGTHVTNSLDGKIANYESNMDISFELSFEEICRQKIPLFADPTHEISVRQYRDLERLDSEEELQGVEQMFRNCDFLQRKCFVDEFSNLQPIQQQITLPSGETIISVFQNETSKYALLQGDRNLDQSFRCSQLSYDFESPFLEEITKDREEDYHNYISIKSSDFSLFNLKPFKDFFSEKLLTSNKFISTNSINAQAFEALEEIRSDYRSTGFHNLTEHMKIVEDNVHFFYGEILPKKPDTGSFGLYYSKFSWWSAIRTFEYLSTTYFSPATKDYEYELIDWNPKLWETAKGNHLMDSYIAYMILEQRLPEKAMDSCKKQQDQQCIEEIKQRAEGRLPY